jgi:hypothetical protein
MDRMNRPSEGGTDSERLWARTLFTLSALMAAFALVDLDAGRWAGAAGNAGVCCLMLSLMSQFPLVRAIVGAAAKRASPADLQREAERLRSARPWTEPLAKAGWTLLLGSLVLRALGVD